MGESEFLFLKLVNGEVEVVYGLEMINDEICEEEKFLEEVEVVNDVMILEEVK